ncbi:DUF4184 family protein [Brevibacillus choshinensis]|uniref:DUF4184 family protein n=1 Tax=Brevibacillus choshinensis TaxID=54911 RepID=A0ABX7FK65_BRECH|nr:DUF4184 family protein [Brevibacillus choshinensis]QRG65395.1 DUF4184 family protein [Brevibacillus choshinensis]
MPFTFAHPAIVLPLRQNRCFHFPALVFGSMAPDFEYFIRMQAYSAYSHTTLGILYFDLPLVVVLCLLFAHVVKRPLLLCLPSWLSKNFDARRREHSTQMLPSWYSSMIFAYSAILGICSHLIWDAFTHKGAFAVSRLSILKQHLSLGGMDLPVYKVLQHGSTCFGLAAIVFVIWKSGRGVPFPHEESGVPRWMKRLYWTGIGTGGIVVASLCQISRVSTLTPSGLLTGVVPFLSGCLIAVLLCSWLLGRYGLKK